MTDKTRLVVKLAAFAFAMCLARIAGEAIAPTSAPASVRAVYELAAGPADIVFLGDSTLLRQSRRDVDYRTTAAMLAAELPGRSVGSLIRLGYRATEYDAHTAALIRRGGRPRLLIAPINLRSFAPVWDMKPGMQFVRERLFAHYDSFAFRASFHPLAAFGVYDLSPVSPEAYRRLPYFDGSRRLGTLGDLERSPGPWADPALARANIAAMYYGAIGDDHRQVQALRSLVARCRAAEIPLLLYITPVPFEEGVAYGGAGFAAAIEKRAAQVRAAVEGAGGRVLDWSRTLEGAHFNEGSYRADEHLRETGRRIVAAMLAAEIRAHSGAERDDAL